MSSEPKKPELHISVRSLVEFIFREGDIDNRAGTVQQSAMQEGSRVHRKIQKGMGPGYQAEVPLSVTVREEDYALTVEGRADGIFHVEEPDFLWYIDEIKGTYRSLAALEEPIQVHRAQAMCYAYLYALENQLDSVGVQLTYCSLDREGDGFEQIRRFRSQYTFKELSAWFSDLMGRYRKWAHFQVQWRKKRQESIRPLEFPYPYREGQRELAADVYRTIARGKILFLQAPTGVGKTISTIFPAVKAVGEGLAERIFYLTAKTVTAAVAKETIGLLRGQGYAAKTIQLTAKEKLCPYGLECSPLSCPYAKGHYDRVNDAVYEILQRSDLFTREEILAQAERFLVCPFELSLDIASWADNILCDYNYVFDPNVYLKRFFAEGSKEGYIFLVDEAHNLVERSRDMYSAVLGKNEVLAVKRIVKDKSPSLSRALDRCNRRLLAMKRECLTCRVYDNVSDLIPPLLRLAGELGEFLEKPADFPGRKEVLDFYFNLRNFLNIHDLVDEHYVVYGEMRREQFVVKLFCVDPSANLQACLDRARSTVLFSATLLPVNYYKRLLSTRTDNYAIYAKSPFSSSKRLLLFGRGVSTKYTRRGPAEYQRIAAYIHAAVQGKIGNYMVFFPSYKLMEEVRAAFEEEAGAVTILSQTANMGEEERERFLAAFEEERSDTLVAFCVMGGIFGEGIDLKNDRLIGAVIVGTGLPQVSAERELLRNYYDGRGEPGFDYAFRYPGMNKVLQAAGRVIRTAEDRGVLLLLDDRFLSPDYAPLFPREWEEGVVCDVEEVRGKVREFWNF